jgi:hypothetical protein
MRRITKIGAVVLASAAIAVGVAGTASANDFHHHGRHPHGLFGHFPPLWPHVPFWGHDDRDHHTILVGHRAEHGHHGH